MIDLDMSPYSAFVWSSWGVSLMALGALAVRGAILARRWKRTLEAAERLADRDDRS